MLTRSKSPRWPEGSARAGHAQASGWTSRLGSWLSSGLRAGRRDELPAHWQLRGRRRALATARREFAESLFDVRSMAAADTLDRIDACNSLAELWHQREAVFSLVARRHDQAEATRRVTELDAHFTRRPGRAALPPPHVLGEPC